jgi:hypothetical protein
MRKETNPDDVLFIIAAVVGVGIIVLFSIATIAKLVIHLIK